ncbi:MAG: hypothetical protein IT232_00245 [Flavobacteriales bacterium]|nr:hypothetical protein [Flavobacteriales bacterium]
MLNKLRILLPLLFFLTIGNLFSQDKLLFLNGKELDGQFIGSTQYETTFKSSKGKDFLIDNYRLFSYTQGDKETIIYKFDTLEGNFLNEKDMRLFVYGERDAFKSYQSNFATALGFAAGGVAGFFMQKEQAFIFLPAPVVCTSITLLFPTSVKEKRLKNSEYLREDEYLRGHERVARSKRTQNTLLSSTLGLGVGFLTGLLVNSK